MNAAACGRCIASHRMNPASGLSARERKVLKSRPIHTRFSRAVLILWGIQTTSPKNGASDVYYLLCIIGHQTSFGCKATHVSNIFGNSWDPLQACSQNRREIGHLKPAYSQH